MLTMATSDEIFTFTSEHPNKLLFCAISVTWEQILISSYIYNNHSLQGGHLIGVLVKGKENLPHIWL